MMTFMKMNLKCHTSFDFVMQLWRVARNLLLQGYHQIIHSYVLINLCCVCVVVVCVCMMCWLFFLDSLLMYICDYCLFKKIALCHCECVGEVYDKEGGT